MTEKHEASKTAILELHRTDGTVTRDFWCNQSRMSWHDVLTPRVEEMGITALTLLPRVRVEPFKSISAPASGAMWDSVDSETDAYREELPQRGRPESSVLMIPMVLLHYIQKAKSCKKAHCYIRRDKLLSAIVCEFSGKSSRFGFWRSDEPASAETMDQKPRFSKIFQKHCPLVHIRANQSK